MRRRWVGGLLAAALLLETAGMAAAADPEPYPDMHGHWAEPYVEVLRTEGVTDGFRVQVQRPYGRVWETRFRPNQNMLTDEWVVLAAKVFNLTPVPVTWTHRLDGGQEVSAWLAAASQAGWPYGRTKDPVTRAEAVDLLIEALGLTPYAQSLPSRRVDQILSVYTDEYRLAGRRRRQVAAATLLGIVEGYPDRTFRPTSYMTRAEGATMLARSALARVDAAPNPFYPDGDGYEDETVFTLTGLRNRNLSRWSLAVTTGAGFTLWSTGAGIGGIVALPPEVVWNGTRSDGSPVNPGEYFYQLSIWDTRNQRFDSVRKPLLVGVRRLEGGLSPVEADPGSTLSLWADTWGDAQEVRARLAGDGSTVLLAPSASSSEPRRWTGSLPLPPDLAPGQHAVHLEASFGPVERTLTLLFTVRDVIHLDAWLEPASLPAGQSLSVWAETRGTVTAVTAFFADGSSVNLAPQGAGRWLGTYTVPVQTPPGPQRVLIRAEGPAGSRQVERWFEVTGDIRSRVQTLLVD
ncbi:MAG: S-layer homology domain-containing protein [Thermaerobacter sp.]|nr:hypothetical protein [Bacillota bacterium]REJ36905.1 MAG: hypothetical protein DIU84_05220 [Bacillota bacterium]